MNTPVRPTPALEIHSNNKKKVKVTVFVLNLQWTNVRSVGFSRNFEIKPIME